MITITPRAAEQIRRAAEHADAEDMHLRLAARRNEDGTIEYAMGFDDLGSEDRSVTSEGIDVVVSASCEPLLSGATLDFVEVSPGQSDFIFINPNDERHRAPTEST